AFPRGSDAGEQGVEKRVDAGVPETMGAGGIDRHLLRSHGERFAVAPQSPADLAQGVIGPLPIELVEDDEIGEVQHAYLFQLARSPEFRSHDIQGKIANSGHLRIALADS